ncbi:septum formation family protein [Kineococcus gynurae]|uniref:Septum formation family protein n=1 Tax=Kineococcus gynurae TaxID=452979 RepID=A0ABV5LQ88_9ACTN
MDPARTWAAPPPAPAPRETDPVSIAGFVAALLGVLGVAAVVLGAVGIARTGRAPDGSPGRGGRGFAVAALVLGVLEVLAGLVLAVVLVVAGTAALQLSDDDGFVVDGPVQGADSLAVGDCFDEDAGLLGSTVEVEPCAENHDYEVVSTFDLPDGAEDAFPGDGSVATDADDRCGADLLAALEKASLSPDPVDFSWYVPSEETWADGDRQVVCLVYAWDEDDPDAQLTGSLAEGTLQTPGTPSRTV